MGDSLKTRQSLLDSTFNKCATIILFQKPTKEMGNHIRQLILMHVFSKHVQQILIDNNTTMKIMPILVMPKLGRKDDELVIVDSVVINFIE